MPEAERIFIETGIDVLSLPLKSKFDSEIENRAPLRPWKVLIHDYPYILSGMIFRCESISPDQ